VQTTSTKFCSERYLSLRLQYALRATLSASTPIRVADAAIRFANTPRRCPNSLQNAIALDGGDEPAEGGLH